MPVESKLFTPWSLRSMQMANRIVIPPMCTYMADNGKVTPWHHMHIGSMATSGAGLVIIEATAVTPEGRLGPKCCGIYDDATAQAMKKLITDVRSYSHTPIAIQLAHSGRKGSVLPPYSIHLTQPRQIPLSNSEGWQTVAPSAIPFGSSDTTVPNELTKQEIKALVQSYADAARRAEDVVGFDGIEVHLAHGYLNHEFLSPLSNHRTDEYGGSLENRMRFSLEVFAAVRQAVSKDMPVWVRISASDYVEGGWDVNQSIALCCELKKLGCDAIHVSSGGLSEMQKLIARPGYQLEFAQQIRSAVGLPVIAVGLITEPKQAEMVLVANQADAIGIGRQILFDPHWPYLAAHELNGKVDAPPSYWRSEPALRVNIFRGDEK